MNSALSTDTFNRCMSLCPYSLYITVHLIRVHEGPSIAYNVVTTAISAPGLDFHAFMIDEIHTLPVGSYKPGPLEVEARHVGSHVNSAPMGSNPVLTILGHSLSEFGVASSTGEVTVEEGESVVQVRVVDIDGDVVDPRLDTVAPPFGVDARLEHERTSEQKSLGSSRPLREEGSGQSKLKVIWAKYCSLPSFRQCPRHICIRGHLRKS
jgi:hypothetical protein